MRGTITALALALWALGGAVGAGGQESGPLDGAEQEAMTDTLQDALENNSTNQASEWVNPDTGRSGAAAPLRTFDDAQGRPCREFITTILIGGREEQGYGTACRQPDGSWQMVSEDRQPGGAAPAAPLPGGAPVYAEPVEYYSYPDGFYGTSRIFLSFSTVHRSGHLHRGRFYLHRRDFRHRHPVFIRERVFVGPKIYEHYHWREHWEHRGRGRDHRWEGEDRRGRGRDDRWDDDRHRSRGRDDDRGRGRGGDDHGGRRGRGGRDDRWDDR